MFVKVYDEAIPGELQQTTVEFLNDFMLSAVQGQRALVGKTLLNPHKDNKWKRGRTRRILYFGAHVRGGKAIGGEVEDIPERLLEVIKFLRQASLLGEGKSEGAEGMQHVQDAERRPKNEQPPEQGSTSERQTQNVVAVTVDFFREGSYTPALPSTVPFTPLASATKQANADGGIGTSKSLGGKLEKGKEDEGTDDVVHKLALLTYDLTPNRSADVSDVESEVCVLWLQANAEMIVGTAEELAKCSPQGVLPPNAPRRLSKSEGEGEFFGMERRSIAPGSAMVWNTDRADGMQVAVPTCCADTIVVSFQTLSPEASSRVRKNREQRVQDRMKFNNARIAEREAKEAKGKEPIPGTPVALSELEGEEGEQADGKTPSIEREHVQAVYDTIAPHWSHTRYKPWPKVAEFLSKLPPNSLVADAGCGNGKYLGCYAAGGHLVGSDTSINLLHVCRERVPLAEVFGADCMRLPYRSGVFDAAISIAVLHHFSTEARRLRALSELSRIMRPGGRVLVYAWAIEQEQDSRRSFAQQDVLVPWHLADHLTPGNYNEYQHKGETSTASANGTDSHGPIHKQEDDDDDRGKEYAECSGDQSIVFNPPLPTPPAVLSTDESATQGNPNTAQRMDPPRNGHGRGVSCGEAHMASAPGPNLPPRHGVRLDPVAGAGSGSVVYQRYCHVYVEGELDALVDKIEGLKLIESYYDRSNWCVLAEREMKS